MPDNNKTVMEMKKSELMSALNESITNLITPLNVEIVNLQSVVTDLQKYVLELERKLINLEFKVARISAEIPSKRLSVENYTVVSNDEAKKLSENASKRSGYTIVTPTQEAVRLQHQCQCSDCDPEC